MYESIKKTDLSEFKNPLYAIIQYDRWATEAQFDGALALMTQSVFNELRINYNEHYILYGQLIFMMRRNMIVKIRPEDQSKADILIYYIRTTVFVHDGKIKRKLPKEDNIETKTDGKHNIVVEKTICDVKMILPVKYEYEIVFLPKKDIVQDITLYNYENNVSDYYINSPCIIKSNEIIHVPSMIMMRKDIQVRQSASMYLNGVEKYLSGQDFLNLRLICKATNNNAKNNIKDIIGPFVLDIFFRWSIEYFIRLGKRYKRTLNEEEYREFQYQYHCLRESLMVQRKYVQEDYMMNSVGEEVLVPIICDIHKYFDCETCNYGSEYKEIRHMFYDYRCFMPEVITLLRYMLINSFLFEEDLELIIDETIIFYSQEYILYLIYQYLKERGRKLPENLERVFKRYMKHFYYSYLVDKSSLSTLRSVYPPRWSDIIDRNLRQSRKKRSIQLDYQVHTRDIIAGGVPMLFRYNNKMGKYKRCQEMENYFIQGALYCGDEYSYIDKCLEIFLKKHLVRGNGNICYKEDENRYEEVDVQVWNIRNIMLPEEQ
jgi:hypothetical protein